MSFTGNSPFMIYSYTYVGFHDRIEAQCTQQFHAAPAPAQHFFYLEAILLFYEC